MFIWKKRAHESGLSIVASFSVSFRILQMGIISIFGPISISLVTMMLQMEDSDFCKFHRPQAGLAQASESVLRIRVTAKETGNKKSLAKDIMFTFYIPSPCIFSVPLYFLFQIFYTVNFWPKANEIK